VPDRAILPGDLILLLERLPPACANLTSDTTLEQVDVLRARIASLTEALRGAAEDETAQLATAAF
jgi:hypothetical protein